MPLTVSGPFTSAYLANVTSTLTLNLLSAVGRKIQDAVNGPEGERAVQRCVHAGIIGLLYSADIKTPEEEGVLAHIFETFFMEPEMARGLSGILSGKSYDMEEIAYLFEQADFDEKTLPAISLKGSIAAFEAAFLNAAAQETILQPIMQTKVLLEQAHLQRELVGSMKELVDFLKNSKRDSIGINAGIIIAEHVDSGKPTTYTSGQHTNQGQADWEEFYLKRVVSVCNHLDLAAIDETVICGGQCNEPDALKVSEVFTTLYLKQHSRRPDQGVSDAVPGQGKPRYHPQWTGGEAGSGENNIPEFTEERGEKQAVPIQAIEAAGNLSRLVILGRPGGGKSTLVNHISTQLALKRLGETDSYKPLPLWPEDEKPLPVRIILRQFAAWIPEDTGKATEGLVWDYLKHNLKEWGCEECFAALKQTLDREGGVIFFDGLDEVHETDADKKRSLIIDALALFARPLEKCRIIVTCREYAYGKGDEWRLPESEFPVVELDLFRDEQIEAFTGTWYRITGPIKDWSEEQCVSEAQKLFEAIRSLGHLKELAQYPLLLTLITQVHGRDGYLPRDRADLYERVVNLLLSHWENRIVRDREGGSGIESGIVMRLKVPVHILREALEKVALSAHEKQETSRETKGLCADIPREDLRQELCGELNCWNRAEEVMEYIQNRAGLLQARDNRTFSFPHRTFQEYLAATGIMRRGDFDELLREYILRDQSWWQEVFLLAAGSSRNTPKNIYDLVNALLPYNFGHFKDSPLSLEEAKLSQLAARAFHETNFLKRVKKEAASGSSIPGKFGIIHERVQQWLTAALEADEPLEPRDRADSGASLALIEDPRPEVTTTEHMAFCFVPGGPFIMGEDDEEAELLHENHQLDYDYWMGRHPVTNSQFKEFVYAGGYVYEHYWTEAAKEGFWNSGKFKGRDDSGFRNAPFDFGSPFNFSNHPVVGVTWYEGLAFTRWLTEAWYEKGWLEREWAVRLPSEAEWEKAARGGLEIPNNNRVTRPLEKQWSTTSDMRLVINKNPSRIFPWIQNNSKKYPDTNRTNYYDTGIDATNAAGCFPQGSSPYGCLDMSGNVRVWTRTLWGKEYKKSDFEYPYISGDGRETESAEKGLYRVLRSSSFNSVSSSVNCSSRYGDNSGNRSRFYGFRLVVSPNNL